MMSKKMKQYVIGLSIAIIIYAIVASWMTIRDIILPPELIDTIILFILASATIFYAVRTSDIAEATEKQAKATKEQAEASVKMAEETKKQRYAEALPILVPTIIPAINKENKAFKTNEIPYEYLSTGNGIKVFWKNSGKGVAINVKSSLWTAPFIDNPIKARYYPPFASESLGIGDKKEISFYDRTDEKTCDISETYKPRLVAEYQDIYERNITTVQEFRIEEDNGEKRAFPGELYFTVNGRRLGQEVTRND